MRRIALFASLAILAVVSAIGLWKFRATDTAQHWTSRAVSGATHQSPTDKNPGKTAFDTRPGSPAATGGAEAKAATWDEGPHEHSNGADGRQNAGKPKPNGTGEEQEHHEESVQLAPGQMQEFGIEVAEAGQGPIAVHLDRPAEIKFDGDHLIHVVPRVDGVVSEVGVTQGQNVSKDALLAVLNSRELAELKANYLAAFERRNLARETFERENRLWEKKISSEKDFLDAKASLAEAEIALRASGQKLRALGFPQRYIDTLRNSEAADLTTYEILAPIAGTVIERHLSLGEAVSADKEVFVIADVSAVWVEVTIYPKDMSLVRAGQNVRIDIGDDNPIEGQIAFVTPHVSEETRTATARVAIDSANRRLKPGMFVNASIEVGQETADVRIPKSAIQNYENGPVVFVQEGEKFEPRPVQLGRENSQYVEVVSGVSAGETLVTQGSFTLKAELEKASFGDGHNH